MSIPNNMLKISIDMTLDETRDLLSSIQDAKPLTAELARSTPAECYNWNIADILFNEASSVQQVASWHPIAPSSAFTSALSRRSRRFFVKSNMQKLIFTKLLNIIAQAISSRVWLSCYVACIRVENLNNAVFLIHNYESRKLDVTIKQFDIRSTIQNMWWYTGSGVALYFYVDISKLGGSFSSDARGYIECLMDVGRVAQAIITEAYDIKLGGWMTPAISEAKTKSICRVENKLLEPIYFLRLGEPDPRSDELEHTM